MSTKTPATIVQLALLDETGDSYYRMRWPGAELAKQSKQQGDEWRVINLDARAKERLSMGLEAELLVLFQSNDIELLPLIEQRRKAGKRTIIEFNDNFYEPPSASPVAREWSSPLVWQGYEMMMRAADAVMITTPGLRQAFGAVVGKEKLHEVPNQFPFDLEPFDGLFRPIDPKGEVRLGWAGSVGHMADFLAYLPALRELLERYPRLKLCVMGNDALPALLRLPPERYEHRKWGSMHEYLGFLKTVQIGFAPLLDTPYNRCRTDIKAVEMGARGVAPILTNCPAYDNFLQGTKVPSFKTPAEFVKIVEGYLTSPELARKSAEAAYQYVQSARNASTDLTRYELYRSMLPAARGVGTWAVATGYHEIAGTSDTAPVALEVLRKADQLLKEKKADEVVKLFEEYLSKNPNHPDILFNRARIVTKEGTKDLPARLQRLVDQFPKDLRFRMLHLATIPTVELQLQAWQKLLVQLQAMSARGRQFWAKDIGKTFRKLFRGDEKLFPILEGLLRMYPEHLDLRLIAAELYELQGKFKEAQVQFKFIAEQVRVTQLNRETLGQLDAGFYQTWAEVLEARAKFGGG
jgi:tetratricopeptide (TPR) repeat protein